MIVRSKNKLPDFSSVVVAVVGVVVVVNGMPNIPKGFKSKLGTDTVVSSVVVVDGAFVVSSNSSDVIPCFIFCKA